MSKGKIAETLFRMKRLGQETVMIAGEFFSADELLTRLQGRPVSEAIGHIFVSDHVTSKDLTAIV